MGWYFIDVCGEGFIGCLFVVGVDWDRGGVSGVDEALDIHLMNEILN